MESPFGMQLEGLNNTISGVKNQYKLNGNEYNSDFGLNLYDFNARWYDPAIGRFAQVDPLADIAPNWTGYRFAFNNPLRYSDPSGVAEIDRYRDEGNYEDRMDAQGSRDGAPPSTRVREEEDGTYTVVGGNEHDGDNGIYIDNNGENGKLIGYSATPFSFFFSEEKQWLGIINPNDLSGKNFLNNLIANKPSLMSYMWNATGGQPYDFKRLGCTDNPCNNPTYHYRGMPLMQTYKGKQIYASVRDVGNIGAGYMAGMDGLSWPIARWGLDLLQQGQDKSLLAQEGRSTQYAERLGWRIGIYFSIRKNNSTYGRLPDNGGLYNPGGAKLRQPIFLNDFNPNNSLPLFIPRWISRRYVIN